MREKPIARETTILLAAITFNIAAETNARPPEAAAALAESAASPDFGLLSHKRRL
jgi:hypothetical protein